jgi:hypothetical protein
MKWDEKTIDKWKTKMRMKTKPWHDKSHIRCEFVSSLRMHDDNAKNDLDKILNEDQFLHKDVVLRSAIIKKMRK